MKFIKILLIFLVLNSCKKNDVNDIEIEVFRFDKEFSLLDSSNFESRLDNWDQKLDDFHTFYFIEYLPGKIRNYKDISPFIMLPEVISFNSEISNRFKNFNTSILPELETVFGRMNYHLPCIGVPQGVITVNSFQCEKKEWECIPGTPLSLDGDGIYLYPYGDTLIIGLDMYLGKENKFYNSYQYLNFMKQEKFLIVDALEEWLDYIYHESHDHSNFLDELIYKGKIVYLIHKFIPDYGIKDVLKYSEEQMNGSKFSENIVWREIIKQDYLYSIDFNRFQSYFNYSPTTVSFNESPGRLGYFIGYKIIDSYMKENDITLKELMKNISSQEILLKSRYNPKNQDKDNPIDKQLQESWFKKYWWVVFGFILLLGYFIYNKYGIKK